MNAKRDSWADGYIDEATGEYVLPSRPRAAVARSAPRRASKNVTPPAEPSLEDFVAATQARARADSGRYWTLTIRCGFWAVVAFFASSWLGWWCWLVSVGLGAAMLWYAQRAWIEGRIGGKT